MPDKLEDEVKLYKSLLESTKVVPWKLDWASKNFEYMGPQIESLLSGTHQNWVTSEGWSARLHARDKTRVLNFYSEESLASVSDDEIDYRLMKADRGYIWVREFVHVIREDNGEISSLIGFLFDISETKKIEQDVLRLQKKLQEFSFKDGLTGVANRRMFDSVMQEEWVNAQRNQQPVSLVMFDIDYFKQYNDFYGHVQGDETLKTIAKAVNGACTRHRDFFARYGGEEFVFILPETDAASAQKMAERCRNIVFKEQIPHAKSDVSQILTISMGVNTTTPVHGDELLDFIEVVDKLMYEAKQNGRNQIVSAS